MRRILLNLNPTDGGTQILANVLAGGAPAPPAEPAAPAAPPTAQAPPAIPEGHLVVPATQLESLLAQMAQLSAAAAAQQQAARDAAIQKVAKAAETGEYEKSYKALQEQYQADRTAWEQRLAEETRVNSLTHKNLAISQALAGRSDLVDGAQSHLATILANDPTIEVVKEGDRFLVRTRTLQSIPDYLGQLLTQPQNRLFLRATAAGGTGATQHQSGPAAPVPTDPVPSSLGEQLLQQWTRRPQQTADPRLDVSQSRLRGFPVNR